MPLHRLTVNIPTDIKEAMDAMKKDTDITPTEQVRRGVTLFQYLYAAQKRGATFTLTEPNGEKSRFKIN